MASLTGGDSPVPEGQPIFACYNMLKREIQALISENEELRRVVDLMRENQALNIILSGRASRSETRPPTAASSRTSERGQSRVLSPGPAAASQASRQNASQMWSDTIDEGSISGAPVLSSTLGNQSLISEGQISQAPARSLDTTTPRDSADTSRRFQYVQTPTSVSFRKGIPHASQTWDPNLSDTVFVNDLTINPQIRALLDSPTTRSVPVSFRLPSTPDTQRPPDVRPKEMTRKTARAADKALPQGATSRANVVKGPAAASQASRQNASQMWSDTIDEGSTFAAPVLSSTQGSFRSPAAASQASRQNASQMWSDTIDEGSISGAPVLSSTLGNQSLISEGQISQAPARSLDTTTPRDSADTSRRFQYVRLPTGSSVRSPAAASQASRQNASQMWSDTIDEGSISGAPVLSSTLGNQSLISEGQISQAPARSLDTTTPRDSTDTSRRFRYVRLPTGFSFREGIPHASQTWDPNLSDTVFENDLPLNPQMRALLDSPTTRSVPVSFRLPSTPDTQRPPDVRPKEMTRKTARAADKALPQGATSRANVVKDQKQQTWERIVGEIAFQLDRRILASIFPERARLYGFTVNNIPEKIIQAATDPVTNQVDEEQCTAMTRRFLEIMNRLRVFGYDPTMHPPFTEYIVNNYGILRERPDLASSDSASYNSLEFLRKVVTETVPPIVRNNTLLLLECLYQLSREDGKPMFIW